MLAGDFNARTKNLNHETTNEEEDMSNDHGNELLDATRASKDDVLNKRGKLFLDFLAFTNITLLNGNTIGDIFGEVTSVNYHGSSVVDYMAVSASLANRVTSFKVGELTSFSDHKPCVCTLGFSHNLMAGENILKRLEDAPLFKYRWHSELGESEKMFLVVNPLNGYHYGLLK